MTKILGREVHPLANLFPMMGAAALDELAADVGKNGLLNPILLDAEGRIIDGRNRGRACEVAGVTPQFETLKGEATAELVLSLNLKRRHLNESQRAMVAGRLAKEMEEEAIRRKGNRAIDKVANLPPYRSGKSRSQAGEMVNVSPRLISSAIKVLRDGCEELVAAVDSGRLAVSTACKLAGLPLEQQAKVLAAGEQEVARTARELGQRPASAPVGRFGIINVSAISDGERRGLRLAIGPEIAGETGVVFLWVPASGLDVAVRALEAGGFRNTSG